MAQNVSIYWYGELGYLGKFGCYTEEEMNVLDDIEKTYKPVRLSFFDFMDSVPEAKTAAIRELKRQIKEDRDSIDTLEDNQKKMKGVVAQNAPYEDHWFWHELIEALTDTKPLQRRMTRNEYRLRFLQFPEQKSTNGVTQQDIEMAKSVPITQFIEVNRSGFTRCMFHNEKTASFHYNRQNNRWTCFGCNEFGDVIDLIMRIHNHSFVDAVKFLLPLIRA